MWQEGSKDERKQGDTHMGKRGRKTETQRKLETEKTGDRERQSERKGISGRECTSKSVERETEKVRRFSQGCALCTL